MDYYTALKQRLSTASWLMFMLASLIPFGVWLTCGYYDLPIYVMAGATLLSGLLVASIANHVVTRIYLEPLNALRQAIIHVGIESSDEPAPNLESIRYGRELVTGLAMKVYDMASATQHGAETQTETSANQMASDQLIDAIPLPLFILNGQSCLGAINETALQYLGIDKAQRQSYIGKHINDILNMSFPNELTFEVWLEHCKSDVFKATNSWNRVRLTDPNGNPTKQFDLAASYTKGDPSHESIIALFDHTDMYGADDQQISFVALAVHELRTPLTIMRGYIEVFEDELGPTLQPELKDFMHKMNASAQQLTAFVSNILNVARVEENQLTLTLHKENLQDIMQKAVSDLELRAQVHGKHITLQIAPDVPAVAADRISVHEVINNLVDNAIKYGGASEQIIIKSVVGQDGMIETSVQDFGIGIPPSVMPHLFDKFYRSHRSRVEIGGTGLGLFLCKAIVTAHGGSITVNSHEGQGSIFTFTLEAYDETKHAAEANGQDGIMRGAHGWIKNHSMYRR